jgi:hypothetical protein
MGPPRPSYVVIFEVLTSITVEIIEFYFEDGLKIFSQNVGKHISYYTAPQPSRKK